jgi:hypothetical protein
MSEVKFMKSGEVVLTSRMVAIEAKGLGKFLMALKLMRRWKNPDHRAALVSAITRAAKLAGASGVAFALVTFFGELSADQSSEMLEILFAIVPAQAIIAGISKYAKEKFGITLPI